MYQKGAKGWLKHFDFMLLDLIVLQLSFLVAFQIRHGMVNPYADRDYLALAIITELADIVAIHMRVYSEEDISRNSCPASKMVS